MHVQLFYDTQEDRLQLIIAENDESRGWWITRRAARLLGQALTARLSAATPPDVLDPTPAWGQGLKADRRLSFLPSPILAVQETHLLTAVRHGRHADGRHVLVLVGKDREEQGLLCDDEALYAFLELLQRQVAKTDWNVRLDGADARQDFEVPVAKLQ